MEREAEIRESGIMEAKKVSRSWCSQQGLSAKERTSKLRYENAIVTKNSEVAGNFILLLN